MSFLLKNLGTIALIWIFVALVFRALRELNTLKSQYEKMCESELSRDFNILKDVIIETSDYHVIHVKATEFNQKWKRRISYDLLKKYELKVINLINLKEDYNGEKETN
jgi:hypothetical protein